MSSFFANPQVHAPAPPPQPQVDTAAKKAAEDERKRQKLAKGRKSTIKTGPQGLLGDETIERKTLLSGDSNV